MALSAPAGGALAAAAPAQGWAAVAAKVLPATVNIQIEKIALGKTDAETGDATTAGDSNRFVGSGFIVDPSGFIVTNKHVIGGALRITVRLQDGTEVPATLIAVARFVDLAVLKVNVGHPLPALHLGDGDAAKPGDPVLAIGDPLGLGTSLSAGIVSGTRRDLENTPFDDYVQTDAAINHGNSGGPLVDAAGDVIGINTILLTNQPHEGSNGLGFAISSNVVAAALRHLLHPERRPIGWIGLHLQGLTPRLAAAMQLPKPGIAIVTKVDPHSPGSAAGLQPGDIILRYGDIRPSTARILMLDIATTPIDQTRMLQVWSGGKLRTVPLVIRAWPGMTTMPDQILENQGRPLPPPPDLGMLLARITPLARKAYKITKGPGVLVASVDHMSEAYSLGLRPGVVIERIDGTPVTTPAAAKQQLAAAVARHMTEVAILVRWSNGPSWLTLHTGYEPPPPSTPAQCT
jgi:serine protease Do